MTNPKCISCDNTEPEQLGSAIQDNFADIDYYCSKCGNIFSTHYDATSFKQADTNTLLEKYPDLKDKIQARDQKLVTERSNITGTTATTATREGGTEEEKSQNVALSAEETQNQNKTLTQSPTAQTNKKNIERQNQSEQETIKKANTT